MRWLSSVLSLPDISKQSLYPSLLGVIIFGINISGNECDAWFSFIDSSS